jgi:hypothetical protein
MLKRNKCLTDKDIQLFIDNGLPPAVHQELQKHLDTCADCSVMVQNQIKWIKKIKTSLGNKEVQDGEVPPFELKLIVKQNRIPRIYFRRILKIAALLIVLLGSYFMLNEKNKPVYKPTAQDLMLWEENAMGNDANQIWHSRTFLMTETNSKGETVSVETN